MPEIGYCFFSEGEYFELGILYEKKTKQLNIGLGFVVLYFKFSKED